MKQIDLINILQDNRELRANNKNDKIAGLSTFWQKQDMEPNIRWKRQQVLFTVTMMAKFSICLNGTVGPEGETTRKTYLLGSLDVVATETKTV